MSPRTNEAGDMVITLRDVYDVATTAVAAISELRADVKQSLAVQGQRTSELEHRAADHEERLRDLTKWVAPVEQHGRDIEDLEKRVARQETRPVITWANAFGAGGFLLALGTFLFLIIDHMGGLA